MPSTRCLLIWPVLSTPAGIFTKDYFAFWIFIAVIWALVASFIIIALPIWESKDQILAVFDGIFQTASQTIRAHYGAAGNPDTSATVFVMQDGMGVMAHVGTTRGYIIRGGRVVRVTHDHAGGSAAPKVSDGTMVALQPLRPTGQQGLGQQAPLAVDAISFKIQPLSRIILCSQGVAGIVAGKDLLTASQGAPSLDAMAGAIIRNATQRQIVADASVVIVDIAG